MWLANGYIARGGSGYSLSWVILMDADDDRVGLDGSTSRLESTSEAALEALWVTEESGTRFCGYRNNRDWSAWRVVELGICPGG